MTESFRSVVEYAAQGYYLTPAHTVGILKLKDAGIISSNTAKDLFNKLWSFGKMFVASLIDNKDIEESWIAELYFALLKESK